jgi:general stress protein 26
MLTGDDVCHQVVRLLRANPYGFLLTAAPAGSPRARLVQHLAVEDDATIWFGTSPRSRKAADIARDPSVTYAIEDRGQFAYAAVYGTASIVSDEAGRRRHWEERTARLLYRRPRRGRLRHDPDCRCRGGADGLRGRRPPRPVRTSSRGGGTRRRRVAA